MHCFTNSFINESKVLECDVLRFNDGIIHILVLAGCVVGAIAILDYNLSHPHGWTSAAIHGQQNIRS
ncbi:hypothetical protein DdX_14706 [Ditylenchus destructor]|uniref:Uncharacterized protein n=1 Tax=Ditylenchus destructor TaxID=166010 RepID=A0AAD4MWC6_9BILA|nr:hypothetical protein DdX_14706 [Ditylenchus destructor]